MERFTHITNADVIGIIEGRTNPEEHFGIWLPKESFEALHQFASNESNVIYGVFQVNQRPDFTSCDYYFLYRKLIYVPQDNQSDSGKPKSLVQMFRGYKHLCGIVNEKGEEIVPLKYLALEPFMNDIMLVKSSHGACLWGLIRLTGETIIEPEYDRIDPPSESLFAVCKNKKVGFMNFKGEIEIPLEYNMDDNPSFFSNGLACMAKSFVPEGFASELYYGYINHRNETILPFAFHNKVHFDNYDVIVNKMYVRQKYGYTIESYSLCIDGSMKMLYCDDSNEFQMDSYNASTYSSGGYDENDPLDAYDGDGSNRWNTD